MALEESLIKGVIDLFADTAIIRYGDIRFKEYYGMSGWHKHDQLKYSLPLYRSFSPDVTAAILVYKIMKTAAMLVYR